MKKTIIFEFENRFNYLPPYQIHFQILHLSIFSKSSGIRLKLCEDHLQDCYSFSEQLDCYNLNF